MSESTTVTMILTEFAHCNFGMFSHLACGDKSLYALEPPYMPDYLDQSCITGGMYRVVKTNAGDDEEEWCILGTSGLYTPIIGYHRNMLGDAPHISLGTSIGCHKNSWAVGGVKEGAQIHSGWLQGLSHYHLFIKRYTSPMPEGH